MDLHKHLSTDAGQRQLSVLWARYGELRSSLHRQHSIQVDSTWSDLERLVFEHEHLQPILLALDKLAIEIAKAQATTPNEIRIKAKVLLDYLDADDVDAVHELALSLCRSILDMPECAN